MSSQSKDQKEDKSRKKRARKMMILFLGRLRDFCGVCEKADQWYKFIKENLEPLLAEFGDHLPHGAAEKIRESTKLTDTTREGIKRSCKNLRKDIQKYIKMMPGGGGIFGTGVIGTFIIGAVVVGIVATLINSLAVKVIIKNRGCAPIKPILFMPLKLPGFELPASTIPDGGQGVAKIPPLKFTVDNSQQGIIALRAFVINLQFNLEDQGIDVVLNGNSLLGKISEINLGERKTHELNVVCVVLPIDKSITL